MHYKQKFLKWIGVISVFIILVFIYKNYNPLGNMLFPKCPFKSATGLDCPGCGSQRAIHQLLNFNFINAVQENILLILSIPYIIIGIGFELWKDKQNQFYLKYRNQLFGPKAIYTILFIIISFWILRNVSIFSD